MTKRALVTGVTGQDGAYLAQFLLDKGYEVHGVVRRSSHRGVEDHRLRWLGICRQGRDLHDGDLADLSSLLRIVQDVQPGRNLQSRGAILCRLLLAPADADRERHRRGRRQHAGGDAHRRAERALLSGLVLGNVRAHPGADAEREDAVLSALALCRGQALRPLDHGELSRELRPARVVGHSVQSREPAARRRIRHPQGDATAWRASSSGRRNELRLGNIDAKRDWGHAKDYVRAMWLMLQQETPDDYVVATGVTTTVRDMCRIAFEHAGLDMDEHVVIDPAFYRPAEVDVLLGDASKARAKLGWEPEIGLEQMIREMVDADIKRVKNEPAG